MPGSQIMPLSFSNWWRRLVGLLLAIFLLALLITWIGPDEFLENISRIGVATICLALGVYASSWLLRGLRLQLMIRKLEGSASISDAFLVALGANALNLILPARLGDVSAILSLKRFLPLRKAVAAMLQVRVLDILALCLFVPLVVMQSDLPSWFFALVLIILILVGLVLLFILFIARSRFFIRLLARMQTVITGRLPEAEDLEIPLDELLAPPFLAKSILLSMVIWSIDIFVAYVVAQRLGPVGFPAVLSALVAANLVKSAPSTPGGLGTFEASFAAILTLSGVAKDLAFSIGFITHLIMNSFTLAVGGFAVQRIGRGILDAR